MAYVKRDKKGEIVGIFNEQAEVGLESLSADNPEVIEFLAKTKLRPEHAPLEYLQQSDLESVRVVEDLIELLVEKNLINFTELPSAAQEKLLGRRRARENLGDITSMMVDETEIF